MEIWIREVTDVLRVIERESEGIMTADEAERLARKVEQVLLVLREI